MLGETTLPPYLAGIDTEIDRLADRLQRLRIVREIVASGPDRFLPLIEQTRRVWGDETAWEWLCRPMFRLNNITPLDAIHSGASERLTTILGAIEYGTYP